MRVGHKVVGLSVAFFVTACVVDAALNSLFFRPGSFWDSLVLDVPIHSIYTRSLVTAFFLVFGIIIAKALSKQSLAEQALKRSEEKYRRIFENSPIGILHFDSNGVITDCNSFFVGLMGSSREKLIGFNMVKQIHNSGVRSAVESALSGNLGHFEGDYLSVTGGRASYSKADFAFLLAEDGTVSGGVGIVEDATVRKRTEDTLRESEERYRNLYEESAKAQEIYRSLIDSCPDAIVIYDMEGRVKYVSDSFVRTFGWTLDEVQGKTLDYVPEEEKEATAERVRNVVHNGGLPSLFETKRLAKDGIIVEVRIAASRFLDHEGKPAGMLVILSDITERKRDEKALIESEERYRKLVEYLPDAMGVHIDGKIVFINPAAAEALGAEHPVDLIGKPILDFVHPNGLQNVTRWIDGIINEGAISRMTEQKLIRLDGQVIDVEMATIPFPYYGRQALMSVGRDVSERKKAEQAVKTIQEELERRVIDRTAQLQAANKELEAFAYSVSHDLRAPLRSIDGFSQVLLEDYADVLDEQGKDHLNRVRRASRTMAQLIDDLLVLSRVTRREMQRETVDLSELALKVSKELQKTEPDRCVELIIEPGLAAEGDKRLLGLMLQNLLGNAWKFTGVREHPRIEFGMLDESGDDLGGNGKPVYFVRDNGAGFEMAYVHKLFAPFQRLHRPSEFPGTGVGLATAQRIVLRHGGRIWGEGTVDGGATFYFTL